MPGADADGETIDTFALTRALRPRVVSALAAAVNDFDGDVDAEGERALAEQLLRAELAAWEDLDVEPDLVVRTALDEMFGLGGLEAWLDRHDVIEIWGQGHDRCWVRYDDGVREPIAAVAPDDDGLIELLRRAARAAATSRTLTAASPILEAQLPDGGRLTAAIDISPRPIFAIRRRRTRARGLDDLVADGTLASATATLLADAVRRRMNIVIAGATGSGKTTLLRALASLIPTEERIVVIEDTRELGLADGDGDRDVVELEAREANAEGAGAIPMRELGRLALRLDPSRVIVGEVRGSEVIPMLGAMNQGNDGSMCTVHASSPAGAMQKLALYAAMSPERLPVPVANSWLAEAVDLVVQMAHDRDTNRRWVDQVQRVVGAEAVDVRLEPLTDHAA